MLATYFLIEKLKTGFNQKVQALLTMFTIKDVCNMPVLLQTWMQFLQFIFYIYYRWQNGHEF